mgnify:FL=1
MFRITYLRRWGACCLTLMLAFSGVVIATTSTAVAAEFTATVFQVDGWAYANVRSEPNTDKEPIGQIAAGSSVGLICYQYGMDMTGPYSNSALWYKIEGYSNGWVSDVMLSPGSDEPVTSQCKTTPTPAPTPASNYNRQKAASWARDNVHSKPRYSQDCTWFVSQALWAGEIIETRDWTSDPAFASDDPPRTATVADDLKNYLVNDSGFATIKELSWTQNDVPEAELGDLIMYDFSDANGKTGADGVIDHVMIITGFSGQYPLVSGHTNDVLDQGWTYSNAADNWIGEVAPGARVYLIHITY